MVPEPFQSSTIHVGIMAHEEREVEAPCAFISAWCAAEWKLLLLNTRHIGANLGDRVPEDLLHHLLGQAYELDFGQAGRFAANDLGIG